MEWESQCARLDLSALSVNEMRSDKSSRAHTTPTSQIFFKRGVPNMSKSYETECLKKGGYYNTEFDRKELIKPQNEDKFWSELTRLENDNPKFLSDYMK